MTWTQQPDAMTSTRFSRRAFLASLIAAAGAAGARPPVGLSSWIDAAPAETDIVELVTEDLFKRFDRALHELVICPRLPVPMGILDDVDPV